MMFNTQKKTILVTGAAGMIGSQTVKGLLAAGYAVVGLDRVAHEEESADYKHYTVDLADREALAAIVTENDISRIIHLAALAHSRDGKEYTWELYHHLNVTCAENVFCAAGEIPVLFISTVDVFGFTKGIVTAETEPRPVSHYAKSKVLAERACRALPHYTIFRFSPVYTDEVKRDIQKRYYLKYPKIAYQIGKGTEYEILNVRAAVEAMVNWCEATPQNTIQIIKDPVRMNTPDYIQQEKEAGRASLVLWFPKWIITAGYACLKALTGENKYTYLLNKAVYPLRTE